MSSPNPPPESPFSRELWGKLEQFLDDGKEIQKRLAAVLGNENPARLFAENIDNIKKQAEGLRKALGNSQNGPIERFLKDYGSSVLSVVALLVSILSFGFTYFWLSPDIKLHGGREVSISYDPGAKTVKVVWRVVVANYGRKMDVVNWIQARVIAPGIPNSTSVELPESGLNFLTRDGKVLTPFTLKENSALDIDMNAIQRLGKDTLDSFFDETYFNEHRMERQQILEVKVDTEQESISLLRLCFTIAKDDLHALGTGQAFSTVLYECKDK
jgi:hypothetical protein